MGKFIKESEFLNSNVFAFETRLNSQYARVLDRKASYCEYFHINNVESTTDEGFKNINRYIGENSPIRFNRIKDFPIYGIEPIQPDNEMNDLGIDAVFDGGTGIVLPNTITPLPGDFFIISYVDQLMIFQVTEFRNDTIKSNNYFEISFSLYSTSEDDLILLRKQISASFSCNINNFGTDDNVLVLDDIQENIDKLRSFSSELISQYKTVFFNTRYNCFVIDHPYNDEGRICFEYDRYVNDFISRHNLFNVKGEINVLCMTCEDVDPYFNEDYMNSFFRIVEKCDLKKLKDHYHYWQSNVVDFKSVFNYWKIPTKGIRYKFYTPVCDFLYQNYTYINDEMVRIIKENEETVDNPLYDIFRIYLNGDYNNPYDEKINQYRDELYVENTFEHYVLIPALVYILNEVISSYLKISKETIQ